MVVIGITSGKGGVGKTTVVSNLATALSSVFKRDVIVLDCNVASSHIRLHFGMYEDFRKTLLDVIKGKAELSEAIYQNPFLGVKIVPSPAGLTSNVNLEKLKDLVWKRARSEYDFVIIDGPPGFGREITDIMKASDKVLVVTTPTIPAISDAIKIVGLARKMKKRVYVVLNRVKKEKYELKPEIVEKTLESKIAMIIPEDKMVPESIAAGVPVVIYKPGSKASIALKKLAAFLIGKEYKPSITDRIKWFFGF